MCRAGHLSVSYGFGLSLRSARTARQLLPHLLQCHRTLVAVPPPLYQHYITSISALHYHCITAIFFVLREIFTALLFLYLKKF